MINLLDHAWCIGRNGTWDMLKLDITLNKGTISFKPVGKAGKPLNAGFHINEGDLKPLIAELERIRDRKLKVIVGNNIGTVYSGNDPKEATKIFDEYKELSIYGGGRAADQSVTLTEDGKPIKEHLGEILN